MTNDDDKPENMNEQWAVWIIVNGSVIAIVPTKNKTAATHYARGMRRVKKEGQQVVIGTIILKPF